MVSVAMCTYNGEEFLSEQLESILNQTRIPDEIVVVDDCSDDKTIEILGEFQESYPSVVKIFENKKNIGITKNFQKSISLTSGDLIAFSDQDDIWKETKLEKCINKLLSDPEQLVCHNSKIFQREKNTNRTLWDTRSPPDAKDATRQGMRLIQGNYVQGATMMFTKDLIDEILPIPENWSHDWYIALMGAIISGIIEVDEELLYYRQHNNNAVGSPQSQIEIVINNVRSMSKQRNKQRSSYERWLNAKSIIESYSQEELVANKGEIVAELEKRIQFERRRHKLYTERSFSKFPKVILNKKEGYYDKFGRGNISMFADVVYSLLSCFR
ncbi:glycosyltransferase family 2 protein [Halorubrum ezzemoulense]|nr:glycosyltransferase family 2 protein [Halorubrum ezzemoulense]